MRALCTILCLIFTVFLSDAQKLKLILPMGHTDYVTSVAFSPNGQYVTTGSWDHSVKLWEASTGKFLHSFEAHTDEVTSVAFSPDGQYVASGSRDKTIKLWRVSTGQLIRSFKGHTREISCVVFSTEGQQIVSSGSGDGTVKLWQVNTGQLIHSFDNDAADISAVAISPDGQYIAASMYGKVNLWQVNTGKILRIFEGHMSDVRCVAFSPDGHYVLSGSFDKTLKLWQANTGQLIRNFQGHTARISSVAFSPDGQYIISGSWDSTAKLWNVNTGQPVRSFKGHTGPVSSVAFSPDAQYIISGAWDNTSKLWKTNTGQLIHSFRGYTSHVNSVAFSINDRYVLAGYSDSTVKLWKTGTGQLIQHFEGNTSVVSSVAFSPDAAYAISGSWDNSIKMWKAVTGEFVRSFQGHPSRQSSIAFNSEGMAYSIDKNEVISAVFTPNGKYIISSDAIDNNAKLWEAGTGQLIHSFDGNDRTSIKSIAVSPDGSLVVSSGSFFNNTMRLWKVGTRQLIQTFKGHKGNISSVSFSPNSEYIISGSWDSTIKLWKVSNGKLIRSFKGHTNCVSSVAFSPDGQRIISGSWDNTIKLWETNTGQLIHSFEGHTGFINSVAFSFSGNRVLSASNDNMIKLWDVKTGHELVSLITVGDNDYLAQLPSLYYSSTPGASKLLHYVSPDLRVIDFKQLDVKYNRPDLVLQAIGSADTSLISVYHKAYEKRVKKLGIDTTGFRNDFNIPECHLINRNDISLDQAQEELKLRIRLKDTVFLLDHFNVWINESPLFGAKGISLRNKIIHTIDTSIIIVLSNGNNIIEASTTNVNGIESYRMPVQVNYTPGTPKTERAYFIGIGIDHFKDSGHNLSWSVKDIRNLSKALKNKYGDAITIDTLFNDQVTTSRIAALKQNLFNTTVNDKIIIAYSGHGLLSDSFDYYLSTYDVNFNNPQQKGLPYDALENLLDSIPIRRKLLLIDACHSGEVDKEEMEKYRQARAKLGKNIKGSILENTDSTRIGMKNSFELMQELFVNVGKSTGATVISAAAGTQFAMENNDLENGIFTYSILEFMRDHLSCTVSQLKQYVNQRVSKLTEGLQVPTARNENIAYDWNVW